MIHSKKLKSFLLPMSLFFCTVASGLATSHPFTTPANTPQTPNLSCVPTPVDATTALEKLKEGNERFTRFKVSRGKPMTQCRTATKMRQTPFAIIVCCSDSRTAPEFVFDTKLGDLFVIRTPGNLADAYVLGGIEFAVKKLGAQLVVVMGHERCGVLEAAVKNQPTTGHISNLVHAVQPAVHRARHQLGDLCTNAVKANIHDVVDTIRSQSDLGAAKEHVKVVPAYYSLDTGHVDWLD